MENTVNDVQVPIVEAQEDVSAQIGGTEVQRCLIIRIVKTLGSQQDMTEDLILRIQEVNVARCNKKPVRLFRNANNSSYNIS